MPARRKINLEKVRASLATPCPHCGEPYTGKIKVFIDLLVAFGHALIQDSEVLAYALRHQPDALRIRLVAPQLD